jgi:hypothetical protein
MTDTAVVYVPVAPATSFQFHGPDGSLVLVEQGGYSTTDRPTIAYLDGTPQVERKAATKKSEKED